MHWTSSPVSACMDEGLLRRFEVSSKRNENSGSGQQSVNAIYTNQNKKETHVSRYVEDH